MNSANDRYVEACSWIDIHTFLSNFSTYRSIEQSVSDENFQSCRFHPQQLIVKINRNTASGHKQ